MKRRNLWSAIAGLVAAPFVPRPSRAEEAPDKRLADLQEMLDIQCSDGNWNYDPYMHGMANGMIFAEAVMTGKSPVYLDAPDKWLVNRKAVETPCGERYYGRNWFITKGPAVREIVDLEGPEDSEPDSAT